LCGLSIERHPDVLVGFERSDDAGVYRLTDSLALVQTVDFFTPVVDDPYDFGRIAAANALSDVYAMGGTPLCAMNIVTFPAGQMEISILREVLRGGLDTLREAGVALVGGHSVTDPELKYGLSVTGRVHPERIWANEGARAGDALVLTKPLGTGIVNTAMKAGDASPAAVAAVTASMAKLNRRAAEIAAKFTVRACTDVTGFGLVGHGDEMIRGSGIGLEIDAGALPFFAEARRHASMGLLPGGLHRNREHWKAKLEIAGAADAFFADLVCDPQTSGGLLVAVPASEAAPLVEALDAAGETAAAIARFVQDPEERIRLG
jgi:selenide, water dikinase